MDKFSLNMPNTAILHSTRYPLGMEAPHHSPLSAGQMMLEVTSLNVNKKEMFS